MAFARMKYFGKIDLNKNSVILLDQLENLFTNQALLEFVLIHLINSRLLIGAINSPDVSWNLLSQRLGPLLTTIRRVDLDGIWVREKTPIYFASCLWPGIYPSEQFSLRRTRESFCIPPLLENPPLSLSGCWSHLYVWGIRST